MHIPGEQWKINDPSIYLGNSEKELKINPTESRRKGIKLGVKIYDIGRERGARGRERREG